MTLKFIYKYLLPLVVFIVISLAFFSPVLQGKKIIQSDIRQYIGMSKQQKDFHKKTGEETYWTDSAFGGMPTYLLGANYPHNYIKKIDHAIRFLPRPADYLFLYFITFYILMLVLKIDYKIAILGALGFGLSTYLIIILGVGHNAKAHAIGYFPLVFSGILLIFRKKYRIGFLLTTLAMALEISANHYQMTYYLMILIFIFGVITFIESTKSRRYFSFFKKMGVVASAILLAILLNATSIMSTKEYASWSTRGQSELKLKPNGDPKSKMNGLEKDYITTYSYGIFETLDLFVPRLLGGSNSENIGKDSHTYRFLVKEGVPRSQALDFSTGLPTYWGDQPIVAAPAYLGAVILFLFVLGLFSTNGVAKKWLISGIIVSLLLSWGKNFNLLTDFMIDYFPYYNKFRSVSSIQVLLELCVPILTTIGLHSFFSKEKKEKYNSLKWASIITFGVIAMLFVFKSTLDFKSASDYSYQQYFGKEVMRMIRLDRKAIYTQDLLRALTFLIGSALILFGYIKGKIRKRNSILLLSFLIIFDLWSIDKRYVNDSHFSSDIKQMSFKPTKADLQIMKDKSWYRVWEPRVGINGARTSYFHNSIGGYHAAKPKRLQNLFDYKITPKTDGYRNILNMLNVKYIIQKDKAIPNLKANGNSWFVAHLSILSEADDVFLTLDTLNNKKRAVTQTGSVQKDMPFEFTVDSTASITLFAHRPDKLIYKSKNKNHGLAVFSEVYYPKGWKVEIDKKEFDFFKVNYLLRALNIPKGEHTITFSFEPEVVKNGSRIALSAFIIFVIAFLLISYKELRSSKDTKNR